MRSHGCVDRVALEPGRPVIVTCVHGTWSRRARWPGVEATVAGALGNSAPLTFDYFKWSGRNSIAARAQAAADLRQHLAEQAARAPEAHHVVIAHSHGANVALHALHPNPNLNVEPNLNTNRESRTEKREPQVAAIVLLSPPLLDCELVDQPAGAANKLLLAAVAAVPLLLMSSRYARVTLDISGTMQLAAALIAVAAWLMLFRPSVLRRRADAVVRQVMLPRLDFPGLVVRAADDEATVALAAASAVGRVARQAWARVLGGHSPVWSQDEQRLRDARTPGEVAKAVFDAAVLVPMSMVLLSVAHAAASDGKWGIVTLTLPPALLIGTAALIVVGGSLISLVLLPAFSGLLWPFGIAPTTASALLNVSVQQAPTPAWQVVTLSSDRLMAPPDAARGMRARVASRHRLHAQPEALRYVGDYLREVFASDQR